MYLSKKNVGEVYKAETKYIDKDTKKTRNVVIVAQNNEGNVKVSKLKSIKKVDANNKNSDEHLVEINHARYGLPKRTGVDSQKFSRNRITKKPFNIEKDKDVFIEKQFKLGSHDLHNTKKHVNKKR